MILALLATASGAEDALEVDLNGDLKTFFTATLPYDHVLMPDNPSGQGVFDNRMKLSARWGAWSFVAHHTTTALTATPSSLSFGTSTGVGLLAPEVVDLSWVAFDEDLTLRGRIDRLSIAWSPNGMDLTVGRQPISFGNAVIFTPLDLVNPFTPAVIDQEYKPGVDAVRVDLYAGVSSKLSLAAAYGGSWDRAGLIAAAYGQSTVGVTDLGVFAGSVRGDGVIGASIVTSLGGVGLISDITLTAPLGGGAMFVRGTLGVLWKPGPDTTITAEAYLQTLGSSDPDRYIAVASGPRFARSEVWLMGVGYGAIAVSHQITPTLMGSFATISNVLDPSAFLAPSVSWSVADNAVFSVGGFVGIGARPDDIELTDLIGPNGPLPPEQLTYLNSEFGTYPSLLFLQSRLYF